MDYIQIEYEKLMEDEKCPFCGWKNKLGYSGSHTVTYECECCGFSTKFINPNDGFSEWEIDDTPEGDDGAFEGAVEKAERNDLESTTVEHFVPSKETHAGVNVLAVFSRFNEQCKDFINDCIEYEKNEAKRWRKGQSEAVEYLIQKIFVEYNE